MASVFKDVFCGADGVDLRTITHNIINIRREEKRVGGLKEGQVISYHNRAGTRFRHYQKIWGRTCLIIPPFDNNNKYSLFLKESELLAKMSTLRAHREKFEAVSEKTMARKKRAAQRKKRK